MIFDVVGSAQQTFNGEIVYNPGGSGGGSLLKTGDGTLELTGNGSDYTGITRIEGGTLQPGDATALPANSMVVVDDDATFDLYGQSLTQGSALATMTLNDGTIESTRYSGATLEVTGLIELGEGFMLSSALLQGSATMLKSFGAGTDTATLSGANTCTGATVVSEGTLQLGIANGISGSSNLVVNGGTFDLGGSGTVAVHSVTMTSYGGSIESSAASPPYAVLAANSYFFEPDARDPGTVSVVLADPQGGQAPLTVCGAGVVTVSVPSTASTYSGGTVVASGTLRVTTSYGLPDGSSLTVGVDSAAAFAAGPQGDVQGPIAMLPITIGNSSDSGPGSDSGSDWATDPGLPPLLRTRVASGLAALQAIEDVIDPSNQVHSTSVLVQACGVDLAMIGATEAANGGAVAGASYATVAAAISLVLEESFGMTATPNGNQWSGGFSNPTGDTFIAFNDFILQFFQTNDVTS